MLVSLVSGPWTLPDRLAPRLDLCLRREDFVRYFHYMRQLNVNTLRIYTLLPPDFYTEFKKFNDALVASGQRPILLLHGIYSPETELNDHPNGTDVYRADINAKFNDNIQSVVGALHGKGTFNVRR